jgi:hypothetical protein
MRENRGPKTKEKELILLKKLMITLEKSNEKAQNS